MYFRKSLSGFLALTLIAQYLVLIPQGAHAIDGDGSNNINLVLTPTLPSSSIIGKNFTLDIALENQSSSEGDAYRPGVILSLPTGVSLVSAGLLGTPTRTVVHASGTTLVFFETKNDVILDGLTVHYPITLASSNAAGVFVSRDIGVLAYVDDSIYGRGAVPTGAPPGTLPGGVDWASGSGVSMADTTDLTFPAAVTSATNLATLPFIKPTTEFTPFDVTKEESTMNLIGKTVTTTLKIHGNSMGALRHFHLQDVIPMNRAFSGFVTPVGGNIGGLDITYDSPSPGLATLDITDVTVPTGTDISIVYETVPLAYDMSSYSGSSPVLDTGSVIPHHDLSRNTVTMHTGALALVGGPYPATTWNNGTSDIAVNSASLLSPRSVDAYNRYANLAKSANVSQAVIGQTVTYTLSLSTAKNAAFTTNGSGTYITDILPDGMTYSGEVSSSVTSGTPLTFISTNTNTDGDTTITWRLNSGVIGADATATIVYQAVVDGAYEGAGDTQYENTETLVNTASFYGTVGDGGLSGEWGETDTSIIDTTVSIDNVTATIAAPTPTTKKHLISITTPTGTVYDWSTGLPTSVPAGSHLRFAVTMDFPEVDFLGPKVIDALPLLAGPNTSAYDFAFQTGAGLRDIYNTGVLFNTEDGTTPAATFNTLALAGTIYPNAPWIQATGANNLEFSLGNGRGKKTFAIMFTVDVLAQKPAGGVPTTGLIPLTNFAYSSFNDDTAVPNPLPIMNIPFDVNFPSVTVTKVASGTTNIETAKQIDYSVTITNTGSAPAFLENIIDTLPLNMTLLSGSIMASGAVVDLPNSAITQVGTGLFISFSTGGSAGPRSLIPLDDTGTPTIRENIINIRYTLAPDTSFVIQGGATRTNTVALDYYASSGALSNGVNNLGHLTASANVTVKSPTLSRSVYATSETDSTTNNLYVGEEVTYRTIITVPQGTLNAATYSETNNANLTFLSGSVVSYSGSLTFSTGTSFSGVTVPFGTIVNTDTGTVTLETIIIDTTYRVNKNAIAGTNYSDNGTFSYSSTSTASALNVNVRKPTLTLTKTATPTIGQYGTVVNYTVTVNNTSTTAHAYDIIVQDILPSKLQYVTGSLVVGTFSGTENELFTTGLGLDTLTTSSGQSFTFQATPTTAVAPNESLTNNVSGIYDTLDDDASLYEWTGALSGNANFSITDIALTHTVIATDLGDTTSALFSGALSDVAIGERVTYDTVIAVPQSTFTGFTITQTLPVGMKFLSGTILIDGIKSHTLSNITITPDNVITFSLGDVDNTGLGAGSGVTLRTEAVLQNNGANLAGTVKNSNVTVSYGAASRNAGPAAIDVVEPTLTVTKVYAPNTGDAGDSLPTTVTVQNIGSVTAYDVVLTDIAAGKTSPDGGYSGTISIGTLTPGETRTYTYNSIIATNVTAGEILTGTSSIIYTSYPGTPVEGERSYSAVDTDYINIINSGAIVINRVSPEATKIGDTVHYQIIVPVSEGNTASLTVTNTIPTGMALIPGSITITESPALSYSGTVTPVISPDSDSILAGQTQVATYAFTDIVNTDVDNGNTETIVIEYDAVVMNSVDTNNGNTKTHTVAANYNSGAIIKNGTSLPITLIEPHLILSVSNSYTDGFTVPYTFTLTNSGTATAYDIDLTTLLPMLVSYTGTLSITNSGGAIGLTRVGNDFIVSSLPVNPGNPLTFTIFGSIDNAAINGSMHTLTGTVTYTSEAGVYTSSTLNILNTERTSGGGVNDYIDANKSTAFTLMLSLLDESISVLDVNGGVGIIGDVFRYTITLTNTGSVPLSGIPVTLDIPSGFTGFTMISLPPGATDISTASGGAHGAGYLSVTGISIPVGQSRTIVYEVTALTSVVPGTIIPTTATVGDSVEGARGGYPSVPVQIDAPRLVSTALEIDTAGAPLYRQDSIHHIFTLTNSGTATGTNVSVTLAWNTGSVFTGSVIFQTGTLIDTGSVIIDSVNNIITFTIPTLPVGHTETIELDSRADGPVGTTITSQIQATAAEGVSTDTLSNTLIIVNYAPLIGAGGGGGGGGGSTGGGKDTPLFVHTPLSPLTPVETPGVTKAKTPKKSIEKDITLPKTPLDALYGEYLEKMAQYQSIVRDELTAGVLGIQYPKILPQTGKNILDRVKKFFNVKLSVDAPTFVLGGDTLTSYLENLPVMDRNRDEYIVLPSNGMITPINTVASGTTDYAKLVNGREINVNNHLKDGVLVYPGTNNAGYGAVGNTVIFGHSSYYASDSGRYKTHFQKIIELEVGEEIWVYKKLSSGAYQKYRYIVEASYDTPAKDTSILAPGIGKNLTLFTCTPIGGITGRWTIKAKYIDEEKPTLETVLYGTRLSVAEKKEVDTFFRNLKKMTPLVQKTTLEAQYETLQTEDITPARQYFLYKIAKAYQTVRGAQ